MMDIIARVHAHMPYVLLSRYLPMVLEKKLNLEIYFSHYALQSLDKKTCLQTAQALKDAGCKVNFHAPFMDLRPAALDDSIQRTSLERIKQAYDLAQYFSPLKIVCHPSFDELYYVDCDDLWLENSIRFWNQLIPVARDGGFIIALENVYEKEPHILRCLFEALGTSQVCFCFDTGHFNVFSKAPLRTWMEEMSPYLGHLHLHDNYGKYDDHLPVNSATFPFEKFFKELKKRGLKPTATLEAHRPEHLWKSLENLQKMSLWEQTD